MRIRQLFEQRKIILEGGNLVIGDAKANQIDTAKRSQVVPYIEQALQAINNTYAKSHGGDPLWSKELIASRKFLAGSSFHFFDRTGISDEIFADVKKTVGDIDTMVDENKNEEVRQWLNSLNPGTQIGAAQYLGMDDKDPMQVLTLWRFPDIVMLDGDREVPINIQIDLEMKSYEGGEPSEWSRFSTSSSWEDLSQGIKGVFHKFLTQSLATLTKQEFILRKLAGRGKARSLQDFPTVDNMYSFAIKSKEGGGLRAKYDPVMDPTTGEQEYKDGMPVYMARDTTGYEKDIAKIFQTLFMDKIDTQDLKSGATWSFRGIAGLMKKYLSPEEQQLVLESFIDKLFGPGAQGLYANDKEKDLREKTAAVNEILKILGMSAPEDLENKKQTYYAAYKLRENVISEVDTKPSFKREGIRHLYNPGSKTEIADRDFVKLVDKLSRELGGKFDQVQVNLKVDGAGIRFGKDEQGQPFFMTSKVDQPLYKTDVGFFEKFNSQGTDIQRARAKNYDKALRIIVTSNFIKILPKDTVVQAEMLFNPMAEQNELGLKFVNINYDPRFLGKTMTLVPFLVKKYSTGMELPRSGDVIDALVAKSDENVKIISNRLITKDVDISAIIDPVASMGPEMLDALESRKRDNELRTQAVAVIAATKKNLSDFIIDNPNIIGKDKLGKDYEGLVLNVPGMAPLKVTSQTMKQAMAAKKTSAAGSENMAKKTAVVAIGSFAGHRGHEQLLDFTLKKAKELDGDPFMFISQAVGPEDPIPGPVKLETWNRLYPDLSNVFSLVQDQADGTRGSLIKKIEHELVKPAPGRPPDYNNIVIMVGSDRAGIAQQAEHLQRRLNRFPGYEHVRVSLEVTPRELGSGGSGISFTQMRNALKDPNMSDEQKIDTWMRGFDGQRLGRDWIINLMDISRQNMGLPKPSKLKENMGNIIPQDIYSKLDRAIELYKKQRIDAEVMGEFSVKMIMRTAKRTGLDKTTVRDLINQYIESKLGKL
jgi:hypothetical protein